MLNPSAIHIFVYGTLKPGYAAYDRLCAGRTIAEVPTIVPGSLYHLPLGYPAITLETHLDIQLDQLQTPDQSRQVDPSQPNVTGVKHWVQGYCLSFRDPQILETLDDYEHHDWDDLLQVCPHHPHGNDYSRIQKTVYTPSGQVFGPAWVYAMTLDQIDRLQGKFVSSGVWQGGS
ncbi:gamma-glutamylcyclotransferase family protein [Alkalinema pantanalense CENA528]|uniref:gamma-glutamylcyclotransferase family protein n=1 Tax=Alkalinema pantanalense TaxID=1620705 RepID=UPI003D6DC9A2